MNKSKRIEQIRTNIINYGNILINKEDAKIKDVETLDSIISLLYTIKHQVEKNIKNKLK